MATTSPTETGTRRARPFETRRFKFDDVVRMVEAGILAEDEPVELIRGELVVVSPQGKHHLWPVTRLRDCLERAYRGAATVLEEKPILLADDNGPEPDLAVVRLEVEREERMPAAADALIVVEVSVTSQAVDRAKAQDYARAGIPVYWRLDVPDRLVEIHTGPRPNGTWASVDVRREADAVPVPGTDTALRLIDILPKLER